MPILLSVYINMQCYTHCMPLSCLSVLHSISDKFLRIHHLAQNVPFACKTVPSIAVGGQGLLSCLVVEGSVDC